MAPNKLENNIKKTLEERHIQPSSQAWNQLSDSLDAFDKISSKKHIWFIGVAASVISVLFLVTTLEPFQNSENITSPAVVNSTSETNLQIENEAKVKAHNPVVNHVVIEDIKSEARKSYKLENTASLNSNKNQVANSNKTSKTVKPIVEKMENVEQGAIVSNDINTFSKSTLAQPADENLSADALLNAEVEALLKQAKSNVSTLATSHENTPHLNANILLKDVELDLEKSFRDKVFETLKTNFILVKTAVADRNN